MQDSNGDYLAEISFTAASDRVSILVSYILAFALTFLVSAYLFLMTRKKFARIREDNDQYKKIKVLTSNFEIEV